MIITRARTQAATAAVTGQQLRCGKQSCLLPTILNTRSQPVTDSHARVVKADAFAADLLHRRQTWCVLSLH